MTKFEFFANFDKNGNFLGSQIFFKNNELLSANIASDTFKNDKNMTKYLYSNNVKHYDSSPKIFKSGGTIQQLPHGNKQGFCF